MWKNNLERYDFLMEELVIADFFSGIGALHQSLKDLGVNCKISFISEIDIDATISYAAGHIENFKDIEFEYPSDEEMRKWLMDRNIGYSYEKDKSSVPRMKKDKLRIAYKANVLLNNLGDISKINYNEIEDFDLMNFSFSCFLPGTLVLTDNGYKNIEDITSNDKVLTHTNQYKQVVKPMINYVDDKIYNVKTMCATDTFVTKEHPFYVRERYRVYDKKNKNKVRMFKEPQWVKAEDLTKDHYVGVAINNECRFPEWDGIEVNSTWNKYGHTKKINKLSRYFYNEFFWWIVGRYIGDGWVGNYIDHKGTDIYNLYICCAKDELQEITDVLDILNKINNDFPYKVYEKRSVYNIRIANVEFAKFLQQFGKGAKNKELTGDILNLPRKELKGFLDGYMSADGCFTQGHHKASSVSNKLTYGIAQCEAKVYGRPYSIYLNKRKKQTTIEGRLVNQNDGYEIKWKSETKKQDKAFCEDGYIWCPINGIETVDYQGAVYNMEVEDDNSYTANGIIVHNCTDLSNSGRQRGMRNPDGTPTRSGLYIYGIEAIRAKKPKYIMIENVKGLIQKKFIDDFYSIIDELKEIGYNCYYPTKTDKKGNESPVCLNAKHFGVPQNRERIFVICVRKDVDNHNFTFPEGRDYGVRLKDVLEKDVASKYYLSKEIQDRFKLNGKEDSDRNELNVVGSSAPESRTIGQRDITYGVNGVMSTLTATDYKQPKQIIVNTEKLDKSGYTVCEQRRDEGIRFFKDNICGSLRTIDACGDKRIIENGAIRGRYNEDGKIEQRLELRTDGITNTLTTVEKDNVVIEHRLNQDFFIDNKDRVQQFEEKENYIQWDVSGKGYGSQQDRVFYEDGNIGTIPANNAGNKMNVVEDMERDFKIRKLTPLECWRLQGFPDNNFHKAQELGISDSSLYKQAGNSIVVNVLYYIFKNLFDDYII